MASFLIFVILRDDPGHSVAAAVFPTCLLTKATYDMTISTPRESQVTLLSETDAKGIITFANDAFCKVSKYSREELVGKPHSIIRHPDMPAELFRMLWNSILRGDVFKAVLKNRARDGSHYWVNASIMATRDHHNQIRKCIGVRHLIPDEQVAQRLFEIQSRSLMMNPGLHGQEAY